MVNSRGAARVRAAMRPARSLEQISRALTDQAQVRDAYADALHQALVSSQDQERSGHVAGALESGARLAAAAVQLNAAQATLNALLAEAQAVAEGIR